MSPLLCSFCGEPIKDSCLTFRGFAYHCLQGMSNGTLIYVDRGKTCFDLSEMGSKSLVGKFPPVVMEKPLTLNDAPNPS